MNVRRIFLDALRTSVLGALVAGSAAFAAPALAESADNIPLATVLVTPDYYIVFTD